MRRLFLLLIIWGCGSCTSIDSPEPTKAGWLLFSYAESGLEANRTLARQVLHFDEYIRQTTDEGREEVQNRYFPYERIVAKDNVWRVLSSRFSWTFELLDGKPLGEPGFEWKISCTDEWANSLANAVISDAGEGELGVLSSIPLLRFRTTAGITLRASYTADGVRTLEFLQGDIKLEGLHIPRLDLVGSITAPLVYRDEMAADPEKGGQLSITAHNEAEAGGTDESAEARYLSDGDVEITYAGKVGVWNKRKQQFE